MLSEKNPAEAYVPVPCNTEEVNYQKDFLFGKVCLEIIGVLFGVLFVSYFTGIAVTRRVFCITSFCLQEVSFAYTSDNNINENLSNFRFKNGRRRVLMLVFCR